ncbi:uncharacterized protein LOC135086972 isoform X5 [Ostrinia nubilalis]|uniref:uncharacterized protein LOC114358662 isoform X7 n=1 Tax=Ostrinia furnacalis TaxID=93504 RepID=UPI00103CE790|nr:uncharacterized protein LOC114358662 isoform X7 [Ostrinia furnacalis]
MPGRVVPEGKVLVSFNVDPEMARIGSRSRVAPHDVETFMEYLNTVQLQKDQNIDQYMIRINSMQVVEGLMRYHEKRRKMAKPGQPTYFGNENGQNVRKQEFKKRRPIRIPKRKVKPAFELEVHVVQPPAQVPNDN